ncbi:MAG: geranyl transferase [Gammaproteobacteria bacterium]|nr:geranyl transferase [Gammaproteobacteria bacterium]
MKTQLTTYQIRVNSALNSHIKQQTSLSQDGKNQLINALEYATLNNGKRLRPALIYAMGEALSIPLNTLDAAACAMELIHSYSLVHDDLPAMDDDALRRGKPTCHIQFDEATAILVGDAQQTLAFQIISEDPHTTDTNKVRLIQLLTQASGIHGMIGGQMIDIQSEGELPEINQLRTMHLMKTGALIKSSLLMGASQSDRYNDIKERIEHFGNLVGLAFQVQDDILDIESSTETLGKPQGSDEEANKSTYPKLLGLVESKTYRDKLITEAQATLKQLNLNSAFLEDLTTYIAKRSY